MIRLSAQGYRAVVDLHDHHLAIKRSVNFVGAPNEQIIPLASIKSAGFRRPAFLMSGRITLTLSGGRAQDSGTVADENTVFFSKDHLIAFEQLFQLIQSAIATPSIEQMVMSIQRDRQERVTETRPEPQKAQAVLEGIDRRHRPYGKEGGADFYDMISNGQSGQRGGNELPLNPTVGEWWHKVPVAGRISLVGVPLFLLVTMCSAPDQVTVPAVDQVTEGTPIRTLQPEVQATVPANSTVPGELINGCYHFDSCQFSRIYSITLVRSSSRESLIKAQLLWGGVANATGDPSDLERIKWDARSNSYYALCSTSRPTIAFRSGQGWTAQVFDFAGGVPGVAQNSANIYQALCHQFFNNELADRATTMGYQAPPNGTDQFQISDPLELLREVRPTRDGGGAHEGTLSDKPLEASDEHEVYAREDARLNQVYRELFTALRGADRVALRGSQREWIRKRDAQCGTAGGTIYLSCMIEMTHTRATALSEGLNNF